MLDHSISGSSFMRVLAGEVVKPAPIWLMRQAGRYLPEYRALRAKSPTFLDFCYNPKMASEATLQPIRRFGFDAAILFSDILVVPDALGQKVTFETGEGPRLESLDWLGKDSPVKETADFGRLSPVFETVSLVRSLLPKNVPLIGFCGSPWTVACYMIGGKGSADHEPARVFAYKYPEKFTALISLLSRTSIEYLSRQIKAGVNVVQLFDSWSGLLPKLEFDSWCLKPLDLISRELKSRFPHIPIIAFPRGGGSNLAEISQMKNLNCVGLDTAVDPAWANRVLSKNVALQGNLDPLAVAAGGASLDRAVDNILLEFSRRPHIFNLGHGIIPETPIENVERMLKRIRSR